MRTHTVTIKRSKLESALQALVWVDIYAEPHRNTHKAITDIKEALAQTEQEPGSLMVYRGELCYKSKDGVWHPVTQYFPVTEAAHDIKEKNT